MDMKITKLKKSKIFWVIVIFVGFFAITQLVHRVQIHAMKSSAFMSASQGGINRSECISFYQDTATCWHQSIQQQHDDFASGGFGSDYNQILGTQETLTMCSWFPSLSICSSSPFLDDPCSSVYANQQMWNSCVTGLGRSDLIDGRYNTNNNGDSNTTNDGPPVDNPDCVSWYYMEYNECVSQAEINQMSNTSSNSNTSTNTNTNTNTNQNTNTHSNSNTNQNTNTHTNTNTNTNSNSNTNNPVRVCNFWDNTCRLNGGPSYNDIRSSCTNGLPQINPTTGRWQCPIYTTPSNTQQPPQNNPQNTPQTTQQQNPTGVINNVLNQVRRISWPW
jgi:hypothetical protein